MTTKIVTPPSVEPISLTEAKKHLRLAVSDADATAYTAENDDITSMIVSAREFVEHQGLHALITQTWDYYLDDFPSENFIRLPFPPLQSVTTVSYVDADGVSATFTDFATRIHSNKIKKTYGVDWPEIYPESEIVIRFVCGFGAAGTNVPACLKRAMLLLIGHFHTNKEETLVSGGGYQVSSERIKLGVDALVNEYRVRALHW